MGGDNARDYPGEPMCPPNAVWPSPCGPWAPGPWNPCWNDTEPVIPGIPGHGCCSGESWAVPVTSGDIDRWDQTWSAVSENSAAWSSTSADDSWKTSAAGWSSTWETVSSQSAAWSSAFTFASSFDSSSVETVERIVSDSSSFLAEHSAAPGIWTNEQYITGAGTESDPLDVSDRVKSDLTDLNSLISDLYVDATIDPSKRRWMSEASLDEIYAWLEDHDKLFWEVKPGIEGPDGSRPDGVFDQLEKLWGLYGSSQDLWKFISEASGAWQSGSHETWELAQSMTVDNASAFKDPDTVYYSCYSE